MVLSSRIYLLVLAILPVCLQWVSTSNLSGWILQDGGATPAVKEPWIVVGGVATNDDLWTKEDANSSSTSLSKKYDEIIDELVSVSFRYYIYTDPRICTPEIKEKVQRPGSLAPGSGMAAVLNMLDALERHPLRTHNASRADFFIVPILFDALYDHYRGRRKQLPLALDNIMQALMESPIFNTTQGMGGKRHVYFSIGSRMFSYTAFGTVPLLIRNTIQYRNVIANGLVVKDIDMVECRKMTRKSQHDSVGDWKRLFKSWHPISSSTFAVGFPPGKDDVPIVRPSYDKFASANWTFFYHTRVASSLFNSTIYRHAPLTLLGDSDTNSSTTISRQAASSSLSFNTRSNSKNLLLYDDILNTSSIGFDINAHEWQRRFANSKFCLVIRGDDPGSRAFLRALRVGCIPVVVSDYFERFTPTLKATLTNFSEFAIFVNEQAFVNNPAFELRKVMREYSGSTSRSKQKVLEKIQGATFAQRVAFPDHPQSLFVPAFLQQAMLALPAEEQSVALQQQQASANRK